VEQIDPKSLQLPPAVHYIGSISNDLRDQAAGGIDRACAARKLVEKNDLYSPIAELIYEYIVLVEQGDRLEPGAVESDDQIEKGLMRSTNRSVLVALDYEDAGTRRHRRVGGFRQSLVGLD
jgi:hypothetical protein